MFNFHRCKIEKIKQVQVYNTKEVQDLYRKVFNASEKAEHLKKLNYEQRKIKLYNSSFTIKMDKNAFSLFLVPIVIENKTYQFIVDTGAQISGISSKHQKVFEKYKTDQSLLIKSAAGNAKEMSIMNIERIFLGTIEVENQSFVMLDENDFILKFVKKEIMQFDGIIGWDILSQFDFELDSKKRLFSVIESNLQFTYCNLINAAFPVIITYDENQKPALFGIDSGAKVGWLSERFIKDNDLKIIQNAKGINIGVHGLEKLETKIVKGYTLSFSESRVTLLNVRSGQTQVFENLQLDGILGNEIFKNKKIQFLNSKGIVRII